MVPLGSGVAFVDAVEAARSSDEAALEKLLGPAQLIGAPPEDADGADWAYQTRVITHRTASLRTGIDLHRAWLFPLRKARMAFFAKVILVGRARSSDVCIDHPSISKLHARIRRTDEGAYTIADAGSTNGTWVGGRRIAEVETELLPGVDVRLGDWELRFEPLDASIAILRSG